VNCAVAKRSRKDKEKEKIVYKIIALPMNPRYEPWTEDLLKWIVKTGSLSFPLTGDWINKGIVQPCLRELDRNVHSHSLRHWRITHLVSEYDFDPYDLTAYSGWTFKTTFGGMGMGSGQLDIYLHLAWKRYFKKLLRDDLF
jgi:integrase